MSDYNDYDLARLIRAELGKLQLDRLERLLREAGETPIDWKRLPAVGEVTDTVDLALDVKAADDATGLVEGYLSTFGNEDLGRDVVDKGAFAQTLARATATAYRNKSAALYPLLWQHDPKEPIGAITSAHEDIHGLRISTRLNMSIERGRQAYHGLKMGYMAFSIGFRLTKYEYQMGVRHLQEIDLKEGSAVTWPMNPLARATGAE